MVIPPPDSSRDLRTIEDVVWVNLGYIQNTSDKWKPQLSVRNCNRVQCWNLLTLERNSEFHLLERKVPGKEPVFYKWELDKYLLVEKPG